MHTLLRLFIVGAVLSVGGVAPAAADTAAADPTDGTWTLNLAKSKFNPGPARQSHTRSYATTAQGVALTFSEVSPNGTKTSWQSNYKYDGKEKVLTLRSNGTSASGGEFNNVLVFDKQ